MESATSKNSSLALERLRIIVKHLEMDDNAKLPTERVLSEQIGVGRRAVRRALEVLEAEGLIWRRQGSGTFVGIEPSQPESRIKMLPKESNMFEVMEVRVRLETDLARLAAIRASGDEIANLRRLAVRISSATDMDSRELWDSALHRAIAVTSRNKLFLVLFDVMDRVRQDENWRYVREMMRTEQSLSIYHQQHLEIIEAIERHDPQAAGDAMKKHILTIHEQLTNGLAGGLTDDAPNHSDGFESISN